MTITAKVIEDSLSPQGARLTTLQLRYPRFIHSEFMTHRTFCLAGDSRLDFELPSKTHGKSRRVHSMTIREFVEKWENGAAEHAAPRHNGQFLRLPSRSSYTAREIAKALGFASALNLNEACRKGRVGGAEKLDGVWVASAEAWEEWRNQGGRRRFSLRDRLSRMSIRQLNERTMDIQLSTVSAVQRSGIKKVFTVKTRNYEITGSEDHLLHTDRGWLKISEVRVGEDSLSTYRYGTGLRGDPFKKIDGIWVSRWNASVRDFVRERQNGVCAHSGSPLGDDFHIHHVEPRHKRPDLAFDVSNVVAVTPDAHKEIHGIQGWQKGVPLMHGFEAVESVESSGEQDTYDLTIAGEFPNFFANGVVVHNSRNASSSRAVPIERMIQEVIDDPAMPVAWGRNQRGMQAGDEIDDPDTAKAIWMDAQKSAVICGREMAALGAHKQIVNRLFEPFTHISVVVTATDWSNFFNLRLHDAADPTISALAAAMRIAMDESQPMQWRHHMPYVNHSERLKFGPNAMWLSAARCARVSYLTHDGGTPDWGKDFTLSRRLWADKHLSPFEHQATAAEGRFANFNGWQSHRNAAGY